MLVQHTLLSSKNIFFNNKKYYIKSLQNLKFIKQEQCFIYSIVRIESSIATVY
ncbi:hypothetical protein LSO9J_90011 [Candidatus Liberibacter solanacearum]